MMKKIHVLILLVAALTIISACSNQKTVTENSLDVDLTAVPTGEADGVLIREYLFYESALYQPKTITNIDSKEDIANHYPNYEYYSSINKVSTGSVPDEELEASGFFEGDEVYISDDSILIYSKNCVYIMEKVTK